ncbi:hemagglutinin repeat-containing protein [Dechloromonas denitrificans]|uniref:hemagglutinin repeat-containing protein n=1 Tax=Dechloromonas denitrificans TaxID=281362 RepID=UPI001CF95B4C|nr:hemagglutinin repeat-containing protein [Dechloromonas denitrificans]UCV08556.1 hemagglutinin repeat-containing protein [Dechloromonas denitrificans]
MNAAVTQAQAFNLHLGVALSAAQIAQLTSDIVWLVEQSVTLPDGSTQKVLVPQVYLLPRSGDLQADGTLIAGQTVSIRAGGDFVNSGTVAGRTLLDLSAANVQNLGGRLTGAAVNISASNDITNLGGRIEAQDSLALTAGRDINIETTTATGTGQTEQGHFSRTQIDRVAGLYVTGSSGSLSAVAGRNMTLTAAEVVNAGSGTTTLAAGNDLTLGTVTTRDVIDIGGNSRNHVQVNASSEVGTRLRTEGDANLIAGNDLLGRAVDLEAQGNLALTAGNDVVLAAGRNEQTIDIASYSSGRSGGGLMGGKKVTRSLEIKAETSTAQEGTLSGRNVSIQAGQDIALEGGQYTAQKKLALDAGRDVLIAAASDSLQGSQNLSSKNGAKVKQQSEQLSSNTATGAILVAGSDLSLKSTRDTTLVATALAAGNTVAIQSGGDLNLQAAQSDRQVQSTDYDQGKKKAVTHTREEAETRQLLSTITAGSGLDISVGGNFSAEVGEKNADGSLKADRMTATGVEQGDSRQQVSITGTGSGGGSLAESAKKALASGIRADANDAFTAGATASGAAALSQYLQSGLVQIKQDPQLAGKIQQVLDSSAGTTLTVKDDAGHVSLTVAGQAQVQEVYNTLKLSENFDVKKFADQGTAQIVTLIAAIVITIYTGGAGAGTLGAAIAGAGANAATIAIINAAIIGMSSTMIGQLAGGASFDKAFQAGLKAGATSALMAGVAAGVSSMVNGSAASSTANTTTSIDSGSQNLQLGNSGTATTATSSIKLDTLMSANYWQQTGLNALAKGALTKAQGGKFEDGLIGSVVGSLAASGAGIVGNMTQDNTLANIVSHAVLGCAVAAASNQDCGSGALGGAASASLARVIDGALGNENLSNGDPNDPNRKAIIAAGAVTGSMVIAAATGKDVLTTGNAAANEVTNNYLAHNENEARLNAARACNSGDKEACAQRDAWDAIDKERDAKLRAACYANGSSAECSARYAHMTDALNSYSGKPTDPLTAKDRADGLDRYTASSERESFKPVLNVPHYDAQAIAKATEAIKLVGNLALDMTPIVGDAKAFAEANTKLDYALAVVGALGPVGDVTKALVKEAKLALEAGDAAKAAEKLANANRGLVNESNRAIKRYADDIEALTGYRLSETQRAALADEMRTGNHVLTLTSAENAVVRNDFNNQRSKLITEWEQQTGQKWPQVTVIRNGQPVIQNAPAHHVIPVQNNGPTTWWNITPAPQPGHTTLHAPGRPLDQLQNQVR